METEGTTIEILNINNSLVHRHTTGMTDTNLLTQVIQLIPHHKKKSSRTHESRIRKVKETLKVNRKIDDNGI